MAPEEQDQVKTGKSLRERAGDAVGGLLVGVILMVIGILFVNRESSQLSYTIEGPIAYLDTEAVEGVVIEVDGEPVENIYGYRVRLWNSGTKALENVPVDFEFQDVPDDFRILNVVYGTTPEFEHRQDVITQTAVTTDTSYVQLQYALLDDENSQFYDLVRIGHEDNVAFVTTAESELTVEAILRDMQLKAVDPTARSEESVWLVILFTVVVFLLISFIWNLRLVYGKDGIVARHSTFRTEAMKMLDKYNELVDDYNELTKRINKRYSDDEPDEVEPKAGDVGGEQEG